MTLYQIGDQPRLTAQFVSDESGALDPTTVVCKIRTPAGVETAYTYGVDPEVVRDSAGAYHFDLLLTEALTWWHRWTGTGLLVAAGEQPIYVEPSAFASP
jgi:hypothetical protein